MQVDYLIIGQGISGTFLSYYLQKEGSSFLIIDDNDGNTPSKIAAGIINPVTGRRMVTVWMAEEIIPFAHQAYEQIGNELNIKAISQKNIIDFFPNPFMRENFLKRLNEGNEYIQPVTHEGQYADLFNYEFGCGEIKPVYTAHTETLLPAWRRQLATRQTLLEESFDIHQLKITPDKIHYKHIEAGKIIFCDGAGSFDSPYFKQLPFAPNKGEALLVEIPGLPDSNIYKKTVLLAPLAGSTDDLFWAGSNYIWDFDNSEPTAAFREATERSLREWLKIPFKVLEHRSGIRPATLERRPFAGIHPHLPNIGILNGLGTKGCSLAPFFAKQLTDHLLYDIPINADADVKRFARILARQT
jgi:glycine/D-amino acid oxidase-like deaminating enzyme